MIKKVINAPRSYRDTLNNVILTPYCNLNKHDDENRLVKTVENGQTTYKMKENNYIKKFIILDDE